MAIFSINAFRGMDLTSVPAERASGTGRHVEGATLRGGILAPVTSRSLRGLGRNRGVVNDNSRYLDRWWHNGAYHWVSWPQRGRRPVHFVSGLIPDDVHNRGYWSGSGSDGRLRMSSAARALSGGSAPGTSYVLGVPRIAKEPSVPASTKPENEDGDVITTAWVHTLVTEFGEEGPPSFASIDVDIEDGQPVELTLPPVSESVRHARALGDGAKRRIYRANTGTAATEYQFVGETATDENAFLDNVPSHNLGEVLPSENWHEPPNGVLGLSAMPGGVLAGYVDDTLWFSEPFLPHAWPEEYALALDAPILGIVALPVGLVVLTRGRPYLVAGAHPRDLNPERGDFPHGCVNGRSIVDMGGSVVYCAPDGLATIGQGGSSLLTRETMSSREWNRRYDVEKVLAFEWEGRYVALLDADDPPTGSKTGFVFDPERGICDLPWRCKGGYSDPEDGSLQLLGLER